jgi:hypothetical protein
MVADAEPSPLQPTTQRFDATPFQSAFFTLHHFGFIVSTFAIPAFEKGRIARRHEPRAGLW